jgi:hypothetical protein
MPVQLPKASKKSTTVLITIGLIGLVYVFYFLGYVKNNEISYQTKAFRILDKIGQNINEKHENNKKNARSIVQLIDEQGLLNALTTNEIDQAQVLQEEIELDSLDLQFLREFKKETLDDIKLIGTSENFNEEDKEYLELLKADIPLLDSLITQTSLSLKENIRKSTSTSTLKTKSNITSEELLSKFAINKDLAIHKVDTIQHHTVSAEEIPYNYLVYEGEISDNKGKTWYLTFEKTLKEFVNSILRFDVFDELLIIRKGDENLSFQTFSNKINLYNIDSLFEIENGLKSGNTKVITVEGVTYKIFLYNLEFDKSEQWLIVGCIREARYLSEIRAINFWVIAYSGFVVMLLLIGMPVLKLAFMNSIERLHSNNVILSGLTLVVGAPLVIVSFLIVFNYYGHDLRETDQRLQNLSNEIHGKFKDEIQTSFDQLSFYDNALKKELNETSFTDCIGGCLDKIQAIGRVPQKYKNYNEVFWMDNSGMQKLRLTTQSNNDNFLIKLGNRAYFKAVRNDDLWKLKKHEDQYFLQSIISWTTGDREIAISKKGVNPNYPVAAITASFQSVIDATFPISYGFSIIQPDGEVILHSESKKNLQENFIDESKNDPNIQSSIYSKTALKTTIDYLGKKHRANIRPIEGTPLSLVVFYNLDDIKSRVSVTWITTLLILMASFMVAGLLVLAIYFIRFNPSKLKIKQFYFNWLAPDPLNLPIYRKLIVANILVIVMIILAGRTGGNEQIGVVFRMFIIPAIAFTFIHFQLNKLISNKLRKVCLFLGVFFLFILNLLFYEFLGPWTRIEMIYNTIFQVLVILVYLPTKFLSAVSENISKSNFRRTYSIFLLSWLLAGSVIPVVYLYKSSYALESEIWTKYSMLDLQNKINEKSEPLISNQSSSSAQKGTPGIYNNFLGLNFSPETEGFDTDKLNLSFDSLIFHLRPALNPAIIKNKGLVYTGASDGSFSWERSGDELLLKSSESNTDEFLKQKIDGLNFASGSLENIFGLFLFFVLLYFLYRIISFCVNKIYGIEFFDYLKRNKFDPVLTEEIFTNNNTIVVGLPGSAKTTMLLKSYEKDKNYSLVDCLEINNEPVWSSLLEGINKVGHDTFIIDNFEYKNDDQTINSKKLDLLEKLLARDKHVLISTEVHPSEIMDSYKQSITLNDKLDIDNSLELNKKLEDELEIWRKIFGDFLEVYKPILVKDGLCENELLQSELKYGAQLQRLCKSLEKNIKNDSDYEEVILEIQQYAASYYFSIWNSLDQREKHAVYDMAKDRFMNTKNKPVIHSLLKKGLIFYDPHLRLMNESFTNFVLSVVDKNEALKMDREVRKKGKWSSMRIVIALILLALVALILFGQPDFFKNANTILIAITGVLGFLPTLTRVQTITKGMN